MKNWNNWTLKWCERSTNLDFCVPVVYVYRMVSNILFQPSYKSFFGKPQTVEHCFDEKKGKSEASFQKCLEKCFHVWTNGGECKAQQCWLFDGYFLEKSEVREI